MICNYSSRAMHESHIDLTQPKSVLYRQVVEELRGLLAGERDWIANLANSAALIYHSLPDLNWAGFYLLKDGELVVGPFQGKPACVRIALGKGVCGTAAAQRKTQVVRDVHEFPGHIACDSASNSEIVVPMIKSGEVIGVLDLDSPKLARFDEDDRKGLEEFVAALLAAT
jgi:GAF domain-containing protein